MAMSPADGSDAGRLGPESPDVTTLDGGTPHDDPIGDVRLACGRSMDDIWASAGQPPDAHQLQCPYCTSARESLADLHSATRRLFRHERDDLTVRAPEVLVDSIIDLARNEIRRGRRLPLVIVRDDPDAPVLTVSEQAVVSIIWRAGDAIPGLEARRCTINPQDLSTFESEANIVDVVITASVLSNISIPDTVEEFRRRVRAAVVAEAGLIVDRVDVVVEDLHE